ncbi:transposase [Holospora curviuscula]|uniref:transposase n=1 Tax=Holospora curviuscula TaxID=1082868 RepID=UPI000CE5AA15
MQYGPFHWLEQCLIKVLKPGQGVILDQTLCHNSPKTRALIESIGCGLVFLPPYSLSLNIIKTF